MCCLLAYVFFFFFWLFMLACLFVAVLSGASRFTEGEKDRVRSSNW